MTLTSSGPTALAIPTRRGSNRRSLHRTGRSGRGGRGQTQIHYESISRPSTRAFFLDSPGTEEAAALLLPRRLADVLEEERVFVLRVAGDRIVEIVRLFVLRRVAAFNRRDHERTVLDELFIREACVFHAPGGRALGHAAMAEAVVARGDELS